MKRTLLRVLRRSRELTLDDVSLHTGISPGTLSRAERGYVHLNDEQKLKLAKLFKVSPDALFQPPAA